MTTHPDPTTPTARPDAGPAAEAAPAHAPPAAPATLCDALLARRSDPRIALVADDGERWSWAELVRHAAAWGEALDRHRGPGPFHVGLLMENLPAYVFALCGAALRGATVVGLNPTRPPDGIARDARLADCSLVVADDALGPLLDAAPLDVAVVTPDDLAVAEGPSAPAGEPAPVAPEALYSLIFTSGTSGDPKAVRCTQGTLVRRAARIIGLTDLGPDDVVYLSMPLFHSNALVAAFAPWAVVGARLALRRRFSASAFLDDVRRHGATYANYVGKPLSYVLAQPERPDDADNRLRVVLGNEASDLDITAFARRFGCQVLDFYGSSEGGVSLARTPDTPPGSLGRSADDVRVLDPVTGRECERARFVDGRLANVAEAVGELVNVSGRGTFEGYYGDGEADAERLRDGWFWTGDLAYRDEDGFVYFAGRGGDRIRVDGENMALGPIERVLHRHPDVVAVAAYPVADPAAGDQLMVALDLRDGAAFDPVAYAAWLDAQADLGTKARPRFARVVDELPLSASNKVRKRDLAAEGWWSGSTWWRPPGADAYEPVDGAVRAALAAAFPRHGRSHLGEPVPAPTPEAAR